MRETGSQTGTARLLGVSFDQVHRVMERAVSVGLANRDANAVYDNVSLDEKAIFRGHSYMSVLSSDNVVLEVSEGRKEESVDVLCGFGLTDYQREQVKTISTDMWKPYIYGAKQYFPNALHCHDNFHLVKYLNGAVNDVRRRETKHSKELKNSKFFFLKGKERLTNKQYFQFDAIKNGNYEVSRAWLVKENFRDIQFKQESKMDALELYGLWRKDAIARQIPEITNVVEMFERHSSGIVNAIFTGASNAKAERLNGAIENLKRIGRGYRNFKNLRTVILFFHGNLNFSHENQ